MNSQDALDFLRAHQPLVPAQGSNQDFSRFDEVRKHFSAHLDDRCLPLLIGALGPGDGYGTYVMVEETLRRYSPDVVVEALRDGLKSLHPSVRYWSAQFAAGYPNARIEDELIDAFIHGDSDTQIAVVTAIEVIQSVESKRKLLDVRGKGKSSDVLGLIDEVVGE